MRALLLTRIGELRVQEVAEPQISRPDEALVEVRTAGICGSDLHGYTGESGRRTPPLVMGHEATGVVRAVGPAVTGLAVGARVAIDPIDVSGSARRLMGMDAPGAYAPRVAWPAANLHPLPDAVSFEAGALAEPLAVAVRAVAKLEGTDVRSAAVVGAGPIGLLVGLVLKGQGVARVAITDLSEARLRVARELGFDLAVDPGRDDAVAAVGELTAGRGADAAFEAVGTGATVDQAHALVRDGGSVVWIGNNRRRVELDMQRVVTRELRVFGTYGVTPRDFTAALDLLASGAVPVEALVQRRARLEDGPRVFDELLASPDVVKCVFDLS